MGENPIDPVEQYRNKVKYMYENKLYGNRIFHFELNYENDYNIAERDHRKSRIVLAVERFNKLESTICSVKQNNSLSHLTRILYLLAVCKQAKFIIESSL